MISVARTSYLGAACASLSQTGPGSAAPGTPDICPTCGLETMRGFGKAESASYGVLVACEAARCDRYVKPVAPNHDRLDESV